MSTVAAVHPVAETPVAQAQTQLEEDDTQLPLLMTDKGKDFCHSIEGDIPYGRADLLAAEFLTYNLMGGTQTVWTGYSDDALRTFQRAADHGWKLSYIHVMGAKDQGNISREDDNNRILQHVLLDWLSGIYKFGPFSGGCNFWRVKKADQLEIELQLRPPYPTAYPLFQNEGAVDGDYVCASALRGFACERLERVETSWYAEIVKICQHPLCGWDFPWDAMLEETTGVFDMATHWYKFDVSTHCKLVPVSIENIVYRQPTSDENNAKTQSKTERPRELARKNPNKQFDYVERNALSIKGRKISGKFELEESYNDNDKDTRDNTYTNSGSSRKQILQQHFQKLHLEKFENIVSILVLDGELYDMGLQLKPSIVGCSVEDELELTQYVIPMMLSLSAKLRKEVDSCNKTYGDADGYGNCDTARRSQFIRDLGKNKVMLKQLTTILNDDLKNNKANDAQNSMTNIDLFSRIPNLNLTSSNVLTPWLNSNMKLWYNMDTVRFKLSLNDAFFPDYHLACYKVCRHKNISRYGPYPIANNATILKMAGFWLPPTLLISFYFCLNVQHSYWGSLSPLTPLITSIWIGNMSERERAMNFRFPKNYMLKLSLILGPIFYCAQWLFYEIETKLLRLKTYSHLVEIPNRDGNYESELNTSSTMNDTVQQQYDFGYSRYEYISVVSPPSYILVLIPLIPMVNVIGNQWRQHYNQPRHYVDYNEQVNSTAGFCCYLAWGTILLGVYLQENYPRVFVYYAASSFALVETISVAKLARDYTKVVYGPNFKLERYCGGEGIERLPGKTNVVPESDVGRDNRIKQHITDTSGSVSSTVVPTHVDNFDSRPITEETLSDVALEQANKVRDQFKAIPSMQFWCIYQAMFITHQAAETARLFLMIYQAYNLPQNDLSRVFTSITFSFFINTVNRLGLPRVVCLSWLPGDSLKWSCLPTLILKTHDYVKFSGGWLRFLYFGPLMIIRGITYGDWSIFDERNYKFDENGIENNQYDPEKRKFTSWCWNGNILLALLAVIFVEYLEDIMVHHFMRNAEINKITQTVVGKTYFEVMPIDIDVEVDEVVNNSTAGQNSNLNIKDTTTSLSVLNSYSDQLKMFQISDFINENAIVSFSDTNKTTNSAGEVNKDSESDSNQKKLDADAAAREEKIWRSKQLMDLYSPDLLFCKKRHIPIQVTPLDSQSLSQTHDVNVSNLVKEIVAQMPEKYRSRFQNSNRQQTVCTESHSDFFGDLLVKILTFLVSLTAYGRRCLADIKQSKSDSQLHPVSTNSYGPCPLLLNCRLYCSQRGGPMGFFLNNHSFLGVSTQFFILPGLIVGWDFFLGRNPIYTEATWFRLEQGFATWTSIENPDPGESVTEWSGIWSIILGWFRLGEYY